METRPQERFTEEWSTTRVIFGTTALDRLAAELAALALTAPVIVTTPGRADALASTLRRFGGRVSAVCDLAAPHVPVDRVQAALALVDRVEPDVLVAIGGGSAIGLAKAMVLERRLPLAAVPTTYSGSEMTSIWGITDGAVKRTGRHQAVAPRLVLYDPALTLTLPPHVSAASGMNAMAHAVEAMYAPAAGPIALAAAAAAIRTLARALPLVTARPDDLDARALAMRGAHAAGIALELSAMGLHHKICHVLGGTFGLPHAAVHAAVLPRVVAFTAPAAARAIAQVAAALGASDAVAGLTALNTSLGLTMSLGALGLRAEDVPRAAALVASSSYPHPRPATEDDVRCILRDAL